MDSADPAAEAMLEFIEKYTSSGSFPNAKLEYIVMKGKAAGDDALIAEWMTACGLRIAIRRPNR